MTPIRSLALASALLALGAPPALSQDPRVPLARADYDRARALQDGYTLVRNAIVVHHWIRDTDALWYRRETERGAEFVIVNAASGRRRLAFDHAAMAAALAEVTKAAHLPERLPIADLSFSDAEHVVVTLAPASDAALARDERPRTVECRLTPAVRCSVVADRQADDAAISSPDGRQAAFVRDGNLWLRDHASGSERQLTRDGTGSDFGYGITPDGWKAQRIPHERLLAAGGRLAPLATSWSPDSRTLLVARFDQRHVLPYPFVETVPSDGSPRPRAHAVRIPLVGERPPVVEWFTIDVASGAATRIAFPYEQLLVLQQDLLPLPSTWWSADGTHLFALAFGDNMESAFLFDIDVRTGTARTVVEERAQRVDLNATSYNPPNVHVTSDGRSIIWWSQRDGWGHLYVYDMASGALRTRLTSGRWLVRDLVHVDEARQLLYFTGGGREGGNPYYRRLYRVRLDGTGLTRLSPEEGDVMLTGTGTLVSRRDGGTGSAAISPSGRYVVYNVSTPRTPTETVVRRTTDGGLVAAIERADATALYAAGFRPPEEFTAITADGRDTTWNVVFRPIDFDSTRSYPVIDVNYASPMTAVVPRNFWQAVRGPSGISPSAFAALGFVVIVVDGRGTTFRSRDFTQSIFGRLHINGLDDHKAAIEQYARRVTWIDTTRVGITGGSYGGWSTIRAMLEYPEFFKVGVAESAPGSMHNMYVDYHWSAQHGRAIYRDGSELRPSPGAVPESWKVLDGRQQASRLAGKLLLTVSELDENVPPASTLQFVDALMKADKDYDLIYFPDTPHMWGRYADYMLRRRWDFFVRHLMGVTPPGDPRP